MSKFSEQVFVRAALAKARQPFDLSPIADPDLGSASSNTFVVKGCDVPAEAF